MTTGVTAVPGFVAGGLACGIKPSGDPDLALVATADSTPVSAAGVFTTNLAQAAPVQISRRHLANGRAAAVVLSSGNANAATGEPGRRDARRMCELAAHGLRVAADDVLVCSTGLIGIPMPMHALEVGIPKLCGELGADGGGRAARAMMTTDTRRRKRSRAPARRPSAGWPRARRCCRRRWQRCSRSSRPMPRPITVTLQRALARAVSESFDCLSVDGCRSTNDTVLVLANGRAGAVDPHALTDALTEVCGSLAEQMARDAEGATKFVRVRVVGARSTAEAQTAARAVANSQLVQCSLNGNDPYWGRVLSELGASGAHIDPEAVDISYNGVTVCRDGVACAHDEAAITARAGGARHRDPVRPAPRTR